MFRALWAALLVVALPLTAIAQDGGYRFIELHGHHVKWGVPVLGDAARITYAFATAPVSNADARNCKAMVPMDALLVRSGISHSVFTHEVAAAFAMWARVAGLSFTRTDDTARADILIGAQAVPRGFAFTDVAYEKTGVTGLRRLEHASICLNPARRWKVGFDGDLDVYDLRYTIAHEIGHAIGLDHPGPGGELMGFAYRESYDGLQPGDIAGVRRLYGSRPATGPDTAPPTVAARPGNPAVISAALTR